MKEILILSQILPFANHNGGSTQIRNLIQALKKKEYIIDFVSFNLPSAEEFEIDEVKCFLSRNTRTNFIIPYQTSSRDILSCYSQKVEKICVMLSNKNYRAIFAEFITMSRYLRCFNNALKFVNIHELYFLRQIRESLLDYNLKDRIYLIINSIKSIAREVNLLKNADIILSYNEIEIEILKHILINKKIHQIPLTINTNRHIVPPAQREYDFLFLGNFDHKPNRDSALFLIKNYDSIFKGHSLLIGGRNIELLGFRSKPSSPIKLENISGNSSEFFNRGKILLAPIISGGGSRIKIVDAMASGNIIITTKMGTEGLNKYEKESILVFEKGDLLSAKAVEIIENFEKYAVMSERCRKYAETFHKIDESLKFRECYL